MLNAIFTSFGVIFNVNLNMVYENFQLKTKLFLQLKTAKKTGRSKAYSISVRVKTIYINPTPSLIALLGSPMLMDPNPSHY